VIILNAFPPGDVCDDASCGAALSPDFALTLPQGDGTALSPAPTFGSAAAMAALGAAIMTARARRKGFRAAQAAWRTSGQPARPRDAGGVEGLRSAKSLG